MATNPKAKAGEREREFRRGPTEVRQLLVEAARALFSAKGYAGTSTREIATTAGVSEALLFRHFGNKAKLFERAVLDPINEFIHDYIEQWTAQPVVDHTPEGIAYAFLDGFYRLLSDNGDLVLALIAAQAYESIAELNDAAPLGRLLDELEAVPGREAALRGYDFDVQVATRLVVGMVMSMALLDKWMFPPGKRRPSRQRILDEMVAFMLHGVAREDGLPGVAEATG
ncbi:MAG TPA: helix-turn-helix domain-containing protein [Acidimicrobiia bacterium]|jgi:AcrR family transcriptional regulator|nr:helix-turn-helix domain-containing protein [Acidimicrobiia bacterium]